MRNESEKTIRAFIAVEAPAYVKACLTEIQNDFKGRMTSASWTRPEGFHLTLKVLGSITPEQAESVKAALAAPFAQPKFKAAFDHSGIFPRPQNARVLWAGVGAGEDGLHALFVEIEDRMAALGFEKEKRPFAGHLTLARFRNPVIIMPALLETRLECPEFDVERVTFFKSGLNPSGSIYTRLAEYELRQSNK